MALLKEPIKKLDIVFENVEAISISGEAIAQLYLENVTKNYSYINDVSKKIIETTYVADRVILKLHKNFKIVDNKLYTAKSKKDIIDRINDIHDITFIDLFYESNDTDDPDISIGVKWADEDDPNTVNSLQQVDITEDFLRISINN